MYHSSTKTIRYKTLAQLHQEETEKMRHNDGKCAAFLITLIPVLFFVTIERTFYNSTADAKEHNKKQTSKRKKSENKRTNNTKNNRSTIEEQQPFTGVYIGKKQAKHELILFSSLSCSSCKEVHKNVLPKIIKEFPDVKIRLEFYIETAGVLEAVKMINIQSLTEETKHSIIETYFNRQSKIEKLSAKGQIAEVHKIIIDLGIDKELVKTTSEDNSNTKAIVKNFKKISSQIKSEYLPAFMLYGETYKGDSESFHQVKKFIEQTIKKRQTQTN